MVSNSCVMNNTRVALIKNLITKLAIVCFSFYSNIYY